MARRDSFGEIRAYYEKILPFYEKESVARAHLDFWRGLASRWRPKRILELGAGLGRIIRELARDAPAVGIDISLDMLGCAASRLSARSRVRFIAADMRRPAFSCRFDLVIAPSDPFSHLLAVADRRKALRAVTDLLSARGRFVLEGLYRPRKGWKRITRDRLIQHKRGVLSIAETWLPVGRKDLWRARYHYRDRRREEPERSLEASFIARAWDPNEIRRLFSSCGLAVEDIWGDFDRRPFGKEAKRLIVVSRRARFVQSRRRRRRQ